MGLTEGNLGGLGTKNGIGLLVLLGLGDFGFNFFLDPDVSVRVVLTFKDQSCINSNHRDQNCISPKLIPKGITCHSKIHGGPLDDF